MAKIKKTKDSNAPKVQKKEKKVKVEEVAEEQVSIPHEEVVTSKKKKDKKAQAQKKVEVEAAAGTDDEAPESIPIARKDPAKKKEKKDKKKAKGGEKPKQNGAIEKKKEKDPRVKVSKKLKRLGKTLLKKSAEPEIVADPPEILATKQAITAAIISLRKATEEEAKDKKKLFDKDFRYCLQICQTKVPKVPTRQVRLNLSHSMYDDTDDVCLIVRDKEVGKKRDPEVTIEMYEQLFRKQKIDFIRKVIPLTQLRADYTSHELKRKLETTYDVFLADAVVSMYAFGIVGKRFINKRKTPIPVKLKGIDEDKWKVQLQKALNLTVYKQGGGGPTIAIPVATHKHTVEQAVANVETVLEQLKTKYPGGWLNIRNIYLKPMENSKVSLPLYVTDINPNHVPVPVIVGPKARHVMKVAAKLERESNKFTVSEKGIIEKKKQPQPEKGKKPKKEKAEVKEEESDDEVTGADSDDEAAEAETTQELGTSFAAENDSDDDDEEEEVKPQVKAGKRKAEPAPVVAAPNKKKQKKGTNTETPAPNLQNSKKVKKQANGNAGPGKPQQNGNAKKQFNNKKQFKNNKNKKN